MEEVDLLVAASQFSLIKFRSVRFSRSHLDPLYSALNKREGQASPLAFTLMMGKLNPELLCGHDWSVKR